MGTRVESDGPGPTWAGSRAAAHLPRERARRIVGVDSQPVAKQREVAPVLAAVGGGLGGAVGLLLGIVSQSDAGGGGRISGGQAVALGALGGVAVGAVVGYVVGGIIDDIRGVPVR